MRADEDNARDARMRLLLRGARTDRFASGFAGRAVAAARADAESRALGLVLVPQFLRLAPLALALIAGLFVYNVWIAGGGRPTLDEAFGIRPVSIEEAYSMNSLLQLHLPERAGR
ncbi:MAG TPA: hypothetical protein VMN78_00540 [Longimicrobiales bacterium]|nr:hypothetical protein [Longimicrobiales bacterium]